MRCVTWSRDSHGLFDYESRYIAKKNIKTVQAGKIIRLNNDVEFVPIDTDLNKLPDARPLLTLSQEAGAYSVQNDTLEMEEEGIDASNQMFVVVRNIKNKDDETDFKNEYKISKGDIIKMGRIKFQVRDYRTPREPA